MLEALLSQGKALASSPNLRLQYYETSGYRPCIMQISARAALVRGRGVPGDAEGAALELKALHASPIHSQPETV